MRLQKVGALKRTESKLQDPFPSDLSSHHVFEMNDEVDWLIHACL